MFTTDGATLCATTTTGVRRAALTVAGICGACCGVIVCDSAAGLQPIVMRKTNRSVRAFFMLTYTNPMKLKMIFNPMAGRGRARKQIGRALAYLRERGAAVACGPSASPADLTRIAAESSREDWDRVVVCGGDGSLHLAVREFDLSQGTLALLPLGSGDDFAKVCGIPRTIVAACDAILFGATREVDVATANGLRYLGVAGLGFDSEVAEYANANAKFLRGSLVYLYSIFRVLPRFTPRRVTMN